MSAIPEYQALHSTKLTKNLSKNIGVEGDGIQPVRSEQILIFGFSR
jgi:hypothetical protein